jgi:hypothetical protein
MRNSSVLDNSFVPTYMSLCPSASPRIRDLLCSTLMTMLLCPSGSNDVRSIAVSCTRHAVMHMICGCNHCKLIKIQTVSILTNTGHVAAEVASMDNLETDVLLCLWGANVSRRASEDAA